MLTQLFAKLAAPFLRASQQSTRIRASFRLGVFVMLVGVFASPGAVAQLAITTGALLSGTLSEDAGSNSADVTFILHKDGDTTAGPDSEVTLDFSTDGDGLRNGDYTLVDTGGTPIHDRGTLTVPASAGSVTITLTFTAVDDNVVEATETLSSLTVSATRAGLAETSLLVADGLEITDNDSATVHLTLNGQRIDAPGYTPPTGTEGDDATTYTIGAELEPAGVQFGVTLTVVLAWEVTSARLATATLFADSDEPTFDINRDGTTTGIAFTLNDDNFAESDETLEIIPSLENNGADVSLSSSGLFTLLTIKDDGDTRGIVLTDSAGQPISGLTHQANGATQTVQVALASAPIEKDVRIDLTSSEPTVATVATAVGDLDHLIFTSLQWDTAQAITVATVNRAASADISLTVNRTDEAHQSDYMADESRTITISSQQFTISGLTAAVRVTEGGGEQTVSFELGAADADDTTVRSNIGIPIAVDGTFDNPGSMTQEFSVTYDGSELPRANDDSPYMLSVAGGTPLPHTVSFTVSAIDDDVFDVGDEEFTLTPPSSGAFTISGGATETTVTVQDDAGDVPEVALVYEMGGSPVTEFPETVGTVMVALAIGNGKVFEQDVGYTLTPRSGAGLASGEIDYSLGPGALIARGADKSNPRDVTIANDTIDEGDEMIVIDFANEAVSAGGLAAADPRISGAGSVTLTDDDTLGDATITLALTLAGGAFHREGGSPVNLTLTATLDGTVTWRDDLVVPVNFSGGADSYTLEPAIENVTIPAGMSSGEVVSTMTPRATNNILELHREVTISGEPPAASTGGMLTVTPSGPLIFEISEPTGTATLTISSAAGESSFEEDAGNQMICVESDRQLEAAVAVTLEFTDGSATASTPTAEGDYTEPTDLRVVLPANPAAPRGCVGLSIVNDADQEGRETFEVASSSTMSLELATPLTPAELEALGYAADSTVPATAFLPGLVAPADVEFTILDDDSPLVRIEVQIDGVTAERDNEGRFLVNEYESDEVTIVAYLHNASFGAAHTLFVSTTNSTDARAIDDFAITLGTHVIMIPADLSLDGAERVAVSDRAIFVPVDSRTDEDHEEALIEFGLEDSASTAVNQFLEVRELTILIVDEDTRGLVVDPPSVANEARDVPVMVSLASEPTADVTVAISEEREAGATGNSPLADFTAGPLMFTTTNWNEPQAVTITGTDGATENVNIVLTPSGGDYGDAALVTRVAVTTQMFNIGFTSGNTSVSEDGGTTRVRFNLRDIDGGGGPIADTTFPLSVGGSAVAGTDYTLADADGNALTVSGGVINVPVDMGANTGEFVLTALDNGFDEDNMDVTFTFDMSARLPEIGRESVSVTIRDNDTARVTATANTSDTSGGGSAEITLALGAEPMNDVFVAVISTNSRRGAPQGTDCSPAGLGADEVAVCVIFSNASQMHTVAVQGVDSEEGMLHYSVRFVVTSNDSAYNGIGVGRLTFNTDPRVTAVQEAVVNDIANSVLKVQVGALESRFQTVSIAAPDSAGGGGQSGSAEFSATLGGQKFDTRGNAGEQATRFVSNLLSRACGGMRAGENARRACDFSTIGYDDLLAGGRFNWNFPGAFTIWGQGGVGGFSGDPKFNADGEEASGLSYDGDFSSTMVGADYRLESDTLFGVLFSSTDSEVTYDVQDDESDIEIELSGISPYLQRTRDSGTRVWGALGFNSGDMTITNQGVAVTTDIEVQTLAAGMSNKTRTGERTDTTWKLEGVLTQVDTAAAAQYVAVDTDSWQTRAAVDLSAKSQGCCGTTSRHVEFGFRADGGDSQKAFTKSSIGLGMDLGAGVEYRSHNGLALGARLRTLVFHNNDNYDEWGLNFNIGYSTGNARGLQFSLLPEWGDTASTDVWGNDALFLGEVEPEETDTDWTPDSVTLRVGYGANAGGINALVTPYGEFSRRGETRANKVGMRFQLPARSLEQLRLNMFVAQTGNRDEPKNSVQLQGRLDF